MGLLEGLRSARATRLFAVPLALILVTGTVIAASQVVLAQRPDPNEEFRGTLAEFYADFGAAYAPFAAIGPAGMPEMIAQARRSVPLLTAKELAVLRDAYPDSFWRNWRTKLIPALMRAKSFAPALEGPLVAMTQPVATSASLMSHSCPVLTLKGTQVSALSFEEALLVARSAELASMIAVAAAAADPTGVAEGIASIPYGVTATARFVLEQIQSKADACEQENHAQIVHDNVDAKVSTRATQSSVDELKKLLAGVLDELKSLINTRANGIEALTNTRASGIESLTNDRANKLEALVNKRSDYADAYQANVVEHQKLDLQVVEIERGRLLLIASEAGDTVQVNVTSVKVAPLRQGPVAFQDVTTATPVRQDASGVLEITLDMRGPAKDADVYLISVVHSHGTIAPIGIVKHSGTVIVRRIGT